MGSDKDKTSKPRKNLWFNRRRGKDGQEDNNIKLSANNMLFISGNGNGEKRGNNAGSADKGVGGTADGWGAAAQAELSRLTMYDTLDRPQDKYKAMCDSGASVSFCNDISLLNNRASTVFDPQEEISDTEQGSPVLLVDRGSNVTVLSSESVRILHLGDKTLDVDVL